MVVAVIALCLSLGGGAYAAGVKIGKGAVGAKQLKSNAVTTAKIQNGAVNSAKIQDGTIVGGDLAGCAAGRQLAAGVCIDTAAHPASDWVEAVDACSNLGGRLPGPGHLIGLRDEPGISLGVVANQTANWTDSLHFTGASFAAVAVDQSAAREVLAPNTVDRPYRCIYQRAG
jgi:hypothetical protein